MACAAMTIDLMQIQLAVEGFQITVFRPNGATPSNETATDH